MKAKTPPQLLSPKLFEPPKRSAAQKIISKAMCNIDMVINTCKLDNKCRGKLEYAMGLLESFLFTDDEIKKEQPDEDNA